MKIVFMGTAELACATLQALLNRPGWEVMAVVTQPDKPRGRDLKLQGSPVKSVALTVGKQILQPIRARDPQFLEELRRLAPDVIVVVAYGQILPEPILTLPRLGCLNVHTSLLPKHRGAAPIQWAILNDDPVTGVTIMKMDAGLDTGPVLATEETVIAATDNSATLHDRLAQIGARLLVSSLDAYAAGRIVPTPQPAEGSTYARKIIREDGRMDWSLPAKVLWNRVRAFTPWPGAFTFLPSAEKPLLLKVWNATPELGTAPVGLVASAGPEGIVVGCGEGLLRVAAVQKEGGRRLSAAEFLAGNRLSPGTPLG